MGKEDCLTAGVHFLTRLNPWVSMHVNYYEQTNTKEQNTAKSDHPNESGDHSIVRSSAQ